MSYIEELGKNAKDAAPFLAAAGSLEKNKALAKISEMLRANKAELIAENKIDIENARKNGMSEAMIDRLEINEKRIEAMAEGVDKVISLDDPVGEVIGGGELANGLRIVKKRVPVIAGTGSNSTLTAIQLSQAAEKDGADGLLIVTPYYNKATQGGLVNHYTRIAASVDVPIILYNVPGRTGCNIQPATVAKLAKTADNIVGIKDATGDITNALRIMQLTDGDFDLYSGEDGMVIPLLSAGGIGVISVLSNVAPRFTHDMVMNYLNGDRKKALEMQLKALPLCDALFCEVNPIPVKTAMNLMGWNVGPLREPLSEMEPEHVQQLAKAMKEFGLKLA